MASSYKIYKETADMSRKEWLLARRAGLGGSDCSAVCGMNQYKSPMSVYLDKISTEEPEEIDNDYTRIGTDLESYVASRWEEITNKKCHKRNAILQSIENPFMLANVDRIVTGENAGLEVKTASPYVSDQWKDGKTPPAYELQCLHYISVYGADRWYLVALVWPHIEIRVIERDEETISMLVDIEKNFWENNVLANAMPEADGSKSAQEEINKMYPTADKDLPIVDLTSLDEEVCRLGDIKELLDKLTLEQNEIKQHIQSEMKDSEEAFTSNTRITWKNSKPRAGFDTKRLQLEKPDIYKDYVKEGNPSRRFLLKEVKPFGE